MLEKEKNEMMNREVMTRMTRIFFKMEGNGSWWTKNVWAYYRFFVSLFYGKSKANNYWFGVECDLEGLK